MSTNYLLRPSSKQCIQFRGNEACTDAKHYCEYDLEHLLTRLFCLAERRPPTWIDDGRWLPE